VGHVDHVNDERAVDSTITKDDVEIAERRGVGSNRPNGGEQRHEDQKSPAKHFANSTFAMVLRT